jgi:tetratricopeptide (TPR) repeat protein
MGKCGLIALIVVCPAIFCQTIESGTSVDGLIEAGHWKRARQIVAARLSSNANDAQAHAWMSKIKEGFGDFNGSISEAERATALDSRNASFHAQYAEACAMTADTARIMKSLSLVRCTNREAEATLALDPKNVDVRLVQMMFAWKAPAIAGGDKKKAVRIADDIVRISPAWGYLAHARLLQERDADVETERVLQNAVKADPSFYRARIAMAKFYCCTARRKRPDMAEKVAREAVILDPSAEGGYNILARVYAGAQRWNDLDQLLAHVDKESAEDAGPYYAAAESLLDAGQDFRRAERYLTHYLAQVPEGRQPTHAEARWLLAKFYEKEGRKADAVRELMTAVQLQPDFEPAKRDLKRLRQS